MTTECNTEYLDLSILPGREVLARFDGGTITSDGGALLLPQVERRTRILERFAACFTDQRDPERIEHTVLELISQRVYALALATRTSTTTINSASIRSWPPSSASRIPAASNGSGSGIGANPWPAKVPSTASN